MKNFFYVKSRKIRRESLKSTILVRTHVREGEEHLLSRHFIFTLKYKIIVKKKMIYSIITISLVLKNFLNLCFLSYFTKMYIFIFFKLLFSFYSFSCYQVQENITFIRLTHENNLCFASYRYNIA